jgi:hypothetical protein
MLDVRLSEWCCSVTMVWIQIPSREEHKIWLPWYSWNIAESGVKHQKSKSINISALSWSWDPIDRFNAATLIVPFSFSFLDFQRHMSWSSFTFNCFRWVICFVVTGVIADYHNLNFHLITYINVLQIVKVEWVYIRLSRCYERLTDFSLYSTRHTFPVASNPSNIEATTTTLHIW